MPEVKYLTDFQRMQVAYAYFTLEEWKLLAKAMWALENNGQAETKDIEKILVKFPSAVL